MKRVLLTADYISVKGDHTLEYNLEPTVDMQVIFVNSLITTIDDEEIRGIKIRSKSGDVGWIREYDKHEVWALTEDSGVKLKGIIRSVERFNWQNRGCFKGYIDIYKRKPSNKERKEQSYGESVKEADTSCSIQPSSGECSDQQIEGEFGGEVESRRVDEARDVKRVKRNHNSEKSQDQREEVKDGSLYTEDKIFIKEEEMSDEGDRVIKNDRYEDIVVKIERIDQESHDDEL